MEVIINGAIHNVPFDLSIITLGQFVEYHIKYGRDLDNKLRALLEKQYDNLSDEEIELDRLDAIERHVDQEALSWYSFWTGYNLFEVVDHPSIVPILEQYRILRQGLRDDEDIPREFPAEIIWKEEPWTIQDYRVNTVSTMSFNEVITSKEVSRQIKAVELGKWDALPYLCTIFFRRKGEKFTDSMINENGERFELLKELPLKYAIAVTFFLNICVHISKSILLFSTGKEPEALSLN